MVVDIKLYLTREQTNIHKYIYSAQSDYDELKSKVSVLEKEKEVLNV